MWQTSDNRYPRSAPPRGTRLGLLTCAVAILLIGVVIGRGTSGENVDEVYLRDSEPTPSPSKTRPVASRDRPPLDHVARADEESTTAEAPLKPKVRRRPSTLIDPSTAGPQWSEHSPHSPGESAERVTSGSELGGVEMEVVRLTNAERRKAGCAPMRVDRRLVQAARVHSEEMAAHNDFEHTSPDGGSAWKRMEAAGYPDGGAENIARGYATASEAVQGWMASRGHRRNILNCHLVATGVGVSFGQGGPWWTQDFGYS